MSRSPHDGKLESGLTVGSDLVALGLLGWNLEGRHRGGEMMMANFVGAHTWAHFPAADT